MRRREELLDSLERELIEPEVFSERYGKIRDLLDQNRAMQAELQTFTDNLDARQAALEASFEAVASFGRNWDLLDHDGRVSLLQTMVKQITVTEEDMHIEVFADSPGLTGVEELSRTGSPFAAALRHLRCGNLRPGPRKPRAADVGATREGLWALSGLASSAPGVRAVE